MYRSTQLLSVAFLAFLTTYASTQAAVEEESAFGILKTMVSSEPLKNPGMGFMIDPESRKSLLPVLVAEDVSVEIETDLLARWESSWISLDMKSFQKSLADDAEIFGWKEVQKRKVPSGHFEHSEIISRNEKFDAGFLSQYLAGFSKLDDVEFQLVESLPASNKKNGLTKEDFDVTNLKVRFDIRGTDSTGWLKNDRGIFSVTVKKSGDLWKIQRLKIETGDSVRAPKRFFVDSTGSSGLSNIPVYLRREAIRRGGYALAVADYNKDGNSDVLVGTHKETLLFKGSSNGTFEKDSEAVVSGELGVKAAIFTDFDNDGWEDLVVTKFDPKRTTDFVSVFKNNSGKFVRTEFHSKMNPQNWPMPATVGDFNGDGFVDVYVGFPGLRDFTNLNVKATIDERKNWVPHGLFLNDGKGSLLEARKDAFEINSGNADNLTYPHSAIAMDLNGDNKQDLIVMDDRGGLSPFFLNLGNGKFREMTRQWGLSNSGYGMGTAVADFNLDGRTDVVMTNVDFAPAIRISGDVSRRVTRTDSGNYAKGLVYFENLAGGKFKNKTEKAGLEWTGLGAAGAEHIDYDNDGWPDLYVATGLWSGSSRHNDISSHYVRGTALRLNYTRSPLETEGSPYMSLLVNHKGNGKNDSRLSMAGFQRNRLFHNNRDGTFTEIGYLAGLDSIADGYVISKIDLQKNGRIDLIIRNGDPGHHETSYPIVQVFSNQTPVGNNSLVLSLEGGESNKDAIGTKVTAKVGKKRIVQELLANNGCAQSEKIIHIGMGSADKIDSLQVNWPSGKQTVLTNVKPGSLHLKEGSQKREAIGALQ